MALTTLSEKLSALRTDRPDEWTMDEFKRDAVKLEAERDEALAKLAAMESQEPVAWVTCRPDICYFTTGRESAERWREGGWTVDPLYAKQVPSHSPHSEPDWENEARRAFWCGLEIGAGMGIAPILPRWDEYIAKRKDELFDRCPGHESEGE